MYALTGARAALLAAGNLEIDARPWMGPAEHPSAAHSPGVSFRYSAPEGDAAPPFNGSGSFRSLIPLCACNMLEWTRLVQVSLTPDPAKRVDPRPMKKLLAALVAIAAGISMAPPASAEYLYLRGKVAMDDGSPPGKLVSIEQVCVGRSPKIVATAGKSGEYFWRAEGDFLGLDLLQVSASQPVSLVVSSRETSREVVPGLGVGECVLRADLSGYHSTTLDLTDRTLFKEPHLPLLVLTPKRPGMDVEIDSSTAIPGSVRKTWTLAEKAIRAANWPEVERQLRAATAADPKFRLGWVALGLAYHNQKKSSEARDAYRRAVALDPKPLQTQLMLVQANLECQDWAEASRTAEVLIAADAKHSRLDAYLDHAIALCHLGDMERAEARVKELLELDKAHRIPRAEYVLGLILEDRQGFRRGARAHGQIPRVTAAGRRPPAVRTRIENLGKPQAAAAGEEIDAPNLTVAAPGEAAAPGGLKAFAAIAHLENQPAYDSFFLDYCRRLLYENSHHTADDHIPAYSEQLQAYMAAVDQLTAAGQSTAGDSVRVTLSLRNADDRKKTARLLRQLGWKLDETGESPKSNWATSRQMDCATAYPPRWASMRSPCAMRSKPAATSSSGFAPRTPGLSAASSGPPR